jgi:hypothetical protein
VLKYDFISSNSKPKFSKGVGVATLFEVVHNPMNVLRGKMSFRELFDHKDRKQVLEAIETNGGGASDLS